MLEKTIKQVLDKKIEDWIESIWSTSLQQIVRENLIVTGGCFTSMINNEVPKDFDCYFRTKGAARLVAEYYVRVWNEAHKDQQNALGKPTEVFVLDGADPNQDLLDYYNITSLKYSKSRMIANTPRDRIKIIFPSDGVVGDPSAVKSEDELGSPEQVVEEIDEVKAEEAIAAEEKKYFPVFLSTNAITLSDGIQVVVRFYGRPSDIHETYDFVHTKAYYNYATKELSIPKEVYECVVNKTLIYTGSQYPVCSVFRTRKFVARGWKINAGQMLKMCMQISQLNLMDIDVLEDQLVGVDSLYFMNLIYQFARQQEKNPDFTLTTGYVMSIIDKIFG